MTKEDTIYTLEFSFQDLMDVDGELKQEFEKLSEGKQEKFILANKSSISNGMNEGTDFSTVMRIIANGLAEDLIKVNNFKKR